MRACTTLTKLDRSLSDVNAGIHLFRISKVGASTRLVENAASLSEVWRMKWRVPDWDASQATPPSQAPSGKPLNQEDQLVLDTSASPFDQDGRWTLQIALHEWDYGFF
jgi:hypothetical protein